MADYLINVFLDDEKKKMVEGAGLGGQIAEVEGKKAIQIPVTGKEQKKLAKGFPDMPFDSSNCCVLPPTAEKTLFDFVLSLKTLDVMKVAILKLYNPLAGKDLRSKIG